jgi:uncharacterized protein YndB with AHSA1/START domain
MRKLGRVTREVTFDQPPATVWSALTEPRRMSAWFGATVELDVRPGGRALFRWPNGGCRGATIDVVDPGRYLVLRWLPFHQLPDGRTVPRRSGIIEFIVSPAGVGTKLTIAESHIDDAHAHQHSAGGRDGTSMRWMRTG